MMKKNSKMKKEQQMAKQKEDSQDYWKENKQVPKADSSKCAQQETKSIEYHMRGASVVKRSGIAVFCTWLFWTNFVKDGILC